MADIAWSAISGGSQVVRKSIEILASQNWTAPVNLAGNQVWLTGCAGGGSGAKITPSGFASGGWGGSWCYRRPVIVTAGNVYAVTIPSGGVGVSGLSDGNAGGDLLFGSLVTLKGGSGGKQEGTNPVYTRIQDFFTGTGVKPLLYLSAIEADRQGPVLSPADTVNGNGSGLSSGSNVDGYAITGGAAGYFGNGTNAVTGAPTNAAANSGAGGGSLRNVGAEVSSAGGSGRLIIEWEEFL